MLIINAALPSSSDLIPNVNFSFVGISVNAGSVANVTNGSGLTPATPALTGIHANYTTSNSVQSAIIGVYPVSLLFTFPAVYQVTAMSFWQITGTARGNGIRSVSIQSSLDNSSWISVPNGSLEFPSGSSSIPSNPIVISWAPFQARFIRFVVSSNWGGTRITLSEVQFAGYL